MKEDTDSVLDKACLLTRRVAVGIGIGLAMAVAQGCSSNRSGAGPDAGSAHDEPSASAAQASANGPSAAMSAAKPTGEMRRPVPLWENGREVGPVDASTAAEQGYLVLDLGDEWVPHLFTERDDPSQPLQPNAYRATYLTLARGGVPNDPKDPYLAKRARRDRYYELYGISPTLTQLRKRLETIRGLECESKLDPEPLAQYRGIVGYRDNSKARRDASQFATLEKRLEALLEKQKVEDPESLDPKRLSASEREVLRQYQKIGPASRAVRAAQAKLRCEGYYEGKPKPLEGALDWSTNEALAEFERRHRVFGWGFLSKDTMQALQTPGVELERQATLRALTERAMHMGGFVEDGSSAVGAKARTFHGADGTEVAVPNLEQEVRDALVKAFGLETSDSTSHWYETLGTLPAERLVAIRAPKTPEYYSADMKLSVEIDRGDVWYEFPYDEKGKEHARPEARRPHLTMFTEYLGQKIPLIRFGTTIGGWRGESVDGTVMWKYKNSPMGPRMWRDIVASPVWLPPPGTPPKSLLKPNPGTDAFHVDYQEIGPGYASAYGLVAAYHVHYRQKDDGTFELGGDDGIRTHGSVDYMSILERHSHGCHRLYNHLAVRLMSFVLRHRPHHRVGQQRIGFRMPIEQDDKEYVVEVDKGGYVFQLDEPLHVHVLQGRILGARRTPIESPIPKYDEKVGAYVTPEGQTVRVDRLGNVTPAPMPASVDGGVEAQQPTTASGPAALETTPVRLAR